MLTDYIEGLLPGWMNKDGLSHWRDLVRVVAVTVDAAIDGAYEARLAGMPGQIDATDFGGFESTDALPLTARDRGIVRGVFETIPEWARRQRQWRQIHRQGGLGFGVLQRLSEQLVPTPPRLRLVNATGTWYTLEQDGTRILNNTAGTGFRINPDGTQALETDPAHPWDWDSLALDGPRDFYCAWPIIYAPNALIADTEETFDDPSVFGEPGSIGTTALAAWAEQIRGVLGDFATGGIRYPEIIIAFDAASFDPLTTGPYPAAGMPDGRWRHKGHPTLVGPDMQWVQYRNETARYWLGPGEEDTRQDIARAAIAAATLGV